MLVAIIGFDRPGSDVRARLIDAHRAWLAALPVRVLTSGPLTDDDGSDMTGSLIIVEADDVATVRSLFAHEPMHVAGLYEQFEIRRWSQRVGRFGA